MKTMHLSPQDVLLGIEINLIDNLNTDQIESLTDAIEEKIIQVIPKSKKEYIYVEIER